MRDLQYYLGEAQKGKWAIGQFNFSNLEILRAIIQAAQKLYSPVIVGTSEGEREFVGVRQAAALVKSLREEHHFPIFINADHTHSLERVKEAVEAGYDAILFDGGKLPLEENIRQTREAVQYIKAEDPHIVVEGELGYIGSASEVLKEMPEGAAITAETMTKAEEAEKFVKETEIDLLAPAVGSLHGMFENSPDPRLDVQRIGFIKKAVKIPLVLHGGSGVRDEDFLAAIKAGISVVHVSTEIRLVWRKSLEKSLGAQLNEVAPHKIMKPVLDDMEKIVENRLRLFNLEF